MIKLFEEYIQTLNEAYGIDIETDDKDNNPFKDSEYYPFITLHEFYNEMNRETFTSIVSSIGVKGFNKIVNKLTKTDSIDSIVKSIKQVDFKLALLFVGWINTCYEIYYDINEEKMLSNIKRCKDDRIAKYNGAEYDFVIPIGSSYIRLFGSDVLYANRLLQKLADILNTTLGINAGINNIKS